jgi:uncharacterized protein YndB with AHSA1/START domain
MHAAFDPRAGHGVLTLTRRLRQPVAKVWSAIATPARIADWMGAEWLSDPAAPLSVGARFDFRFRHSDLPSEGRVLRFEPPRLIEFTWFENLPSSGRVEWALEPDGEGCLLTLTNRFGMVDDAPRTAAGWAAIIDQLAGAFGEAGEALGDWKSRRDAYAAAFGPEASRDARLVVQDGVKSLRFERIVAAPPAAVWSALTTPEGLKRWLLCEATVDGAPGGRFDLMLEGGSRVPGVIQRWEPGRLVEFTWPEKAANGDSLVTITVEPYGDLSRVTLIHRLDKGGEVNDFAGGWHIHLDLLDAAAAGAQGAFDLDRFRAQRMIYAMTL